MKKQTVAALLAALCLGGCAHHLTLMPVDGQGASGSGSATGVGGGGDLTVQLEGKSFRGRWVYAPTGGMVGFGTAYSGTQVATGTMIGAPGGGGGVAHLNGPDGASLRCHFDYSQWTAKGIGQCQRNDGKVYDLVIG